MFTIEQLKRQLKLISTIDSRIERPEVVSCNYYTNQKYSAQVICYLSCRFTDKFYDWYTEEWINKFSLFTDTPWVAARESLQNNVVYTKIYKCYATKQQICKSKIIFKVTSHLHGNNKITITINYLKCKCVVPEKLLSVNAKQSLSDCNEEMSSIHQLFYKYFSDSYNPITAKMYYNLTVLVNESDQMTNPTMRDVRLFWHAWKCQLAKKLTNVDKFINIEKIMKRKVSEMDTLGVLIRTIDQDTVILITPTMKRVLAFHELDVLIVSSISVPQGPQASLLFVPNKIGALCFACVLHQKRTQEAYKHIFLTIKAVIENDFEKTFNPRSIVIPNSRDHILLALKAVFKNSKVMISPWSICRDLWRYMYIGRTLDPTHHKTMATFHDIMHAADAKSAHLRFIKFTTSIEFPTIPKLLRKHLEDIWNKNRLLVWWSNDNNSLVELTITLLQQLIITKCEWFNIVNMCDVICTLDTHFQELMTGWVSKKSMFKTYTKFLPKLSPTINAWTINMTQPHQFLLTKGNTRTMLRTDTWLCSCSSGKNAFYCEHLGAIMEFTDVAVTLTDDGRDLLKLIAGENNVYTEYSKDNSHVDNVHPPYSDGYYLFHLPIENITKKPENFDGVKESDNIINCVPKNLEKTAYVYKENTHLIADPDLKENVKGETSLNSTNLTGFELLKTKTKQQELEDLGDGVEITDIPQKTIKKENPLQIKDEPMEIDNTDMPNNVDSIKIENMENTDETNLKYKKSQEEMEHFIEIDLKKEITQDNDENMTETGMENLGNNNLLEEYMSQEYEVAENNFEAEYKDAVSRLCAEFKSLDDCLSQSPSASKLASIVRLTNELTRATVQLQDIKPEIEDYTN